MDSCPYIRKVLITGASSGIGEATAHLFAENKFTVYALSRHCVEDTLCFNGGGKIISIRADVSDEFSVKRAVAKIDSLGIVIHCAGFGISGSAESTPLYAVKDQMNTNYFGVLNVNSQVLPLLRQNDKSLIMFASSFAGLVPIPFQSHYSSSKFALEAYAEALGMEAKPFGVRVCIVEPGDIKTGFTRARTYNEPKYSAYYNRCADAVSKMAKDEQNGMAPVTVAKVFYRQAHRKNPKTRIVVGFSYKILAVLAKISPVKLRDSILSKIY